MTIATVTLSANLTQSTSTDCWNSQTHVSLTFSWVSVVTDHTELQPLKLKCCMVSVPQVMQTGITTRLIPRPIGMASSYTLTMGRG